ncbi:MAG TPA: hypothetical protein VJU83_09635 [Burkholderiales bacterium]|nr:hypothetical protein [Burkholderiales bacterium]
MPNNNETATPATPSQFAPNAFRRRRNEFRAWLIWQLNLRGANLSDRPDYGDLQAAVEKYFLEPTRQAVRR